MRCCPCTGYKSTNKVLSIRQLSLSDPKAKYEYSISTSTSSLRIHLGAAHREAYDHACKVNNWPNKLKGATSSKSEISDSALQAQVQTPFSETLFLDRLVNFITVDDQVSMLAYGYFYQANFSFSRSMLSNAVNFETCFSSCARSCVFPDEPK